jgi:hypothetical protein
MLYSQLRQIVDIDRRIASMHRELEKLYKQRAEVVNTNLQDESYKIELYSDIQKQPVKPTKFRSAKTEWIDNQVQLLTKTWDKYGLKVPHGKKFDQHIDRAYDVINELEALNPQLAGQLGIVLVPPTRAKIFPANKKLRTKQPFMLGEDQLVMVEIDTQKHRDWRVLVAVVGPTGLAWGDAKEIIGTKRFKQANYDLRALGPVEYTAMTLQSNFVIDLGTWTMLLRDFDNLDEDEVVAATMVNGSYSFSRGDKHTAFGDDRFRPAVEIIL